MSIFNREEQYLKLLAERKFSVREFSERLFISEPTVRRDLALLREKDLIAVKRGVAELKSHRADRRIPLLVRRSENEEAKKIIAQKAVSHVKDGFAVMLDASTTASYIVPHLATLKNVLLITNGARTAIEAVALGIRTICIGGELTEESLSYVGTDAECILSRYNADVAFFSARGLDGEGTVTDTSILENSIRRIMIANSKEKYLVIDSTKLNRTCLNTLCNASSLDGVITEC